MPMTPEIYDKVEKFRETIPQDIGILVYNKRLLPEKAMKIILKAVEFVLLDKGED